MLDVLMKPLVIPPAAQRDANSVQMLSAWIAEKGLHCTINIGIWHESDRKEVPAWGILLADVIRHIGNAHQAEYGSSAPDTVAGILRALHEELGEPTSPATGAFHHGHS